MNLRSEKTRRERRGGLSRPAFTKGGENYFAIETTTKAVTWAERLSNISIEGRCLEKNRRDLSGMKNWLIGAVAGMSF